MYRHIFLLILLLLMQGCGSSENKQNDKQRHGADKHRFQGGTPDSLEQLRIPVEVTRVERGEITSRLEYHTTMQTEDAVEVFPLVAGNVSQLHVEEGDRVEKGGRLLSLKDEQLRINLEQAELEYGHLQTDFQRAEELYAKDLMSEQEYADKRYKLERARLQLATVRLRLERSVITAPLSGVISHRAVGIGEYVTAASQVFSIINTTEPIAELRLSQMYYPVVGRGLRAEVRSDLYPQRLFHGEVKRINPTVDAASGTFKVTVAIQNPRELLRPGMFVNVQLILDVHPEAVLIPKNALIYESDKTCAFVVENDTLALKRELQLDYSDAQAVEVSSGVKAGETIVVVGQSALQDSARVRIIHHHTGSL